MIHLRLKENTKEYYPGQTIRGQVGWQESQTPRDAALRLFWYTEGKGDQDIGIVEERIFDAPSATQQEDFQFQLPKEPYSFSGKLISLRWALELVLDGGKEVERIDLVVSPWKKEPLLNAVPEEKGAAFRMSSS